MNYFLIIFYFKVSKWRVQRRLIQPAFNPKILRSYIDIFERHSKILVQNMSVKLNRDEFEILPYFSTFALNSVIGKYFYTSEYLVQKNRFFDIFYLEFNYIILESTMGISETSTPENYPKYVTAVRRFYLFYIYKKTISLLIFKNLFLFSQ